jgi:hypothetical protein
MNSKAGTYHLGGGSSAASLALIFAFTLFGVAEPADADTSWSSLEIIDVDNHPWDKQPRFQAKTKTIFRGPNESSLVYTSFQPHWDMSPPGDPLGPHYHLWHEWAYVIRGDFVIHEPVSPYQKSPVAYRFLEGTWLDRPAYTLHGGGWETGGLRAQNPCILLIFEEGDGSVITVGSDGDHFKPDFLDSKPDPYRPDWRAVKQFQHPWIVDSALDQEWETDPERNGRFVKWLSDDPAQGFRAQLIKIPPGWSAPAGTAKTYFEKAHRMRYMLFGDMKVWRFENPSAKSEALRVKENHFIYQPPRSIWGYGSGPVTEAGAIWLDVTYAKQLSVGDGPIEEPKRVME